MTATPSAPDATTGDAEPEETVAGAGLADVFGAITLATPTWTILRHPFGLALACLALFAGLVEVIQTLAQSVVGAG